MKQHFESQAEDRDLFTTEWVQVERFERVYKISEIEFFATNCKNGKYHRLETGCDVDVEDGQERAWIAGFFYERVARIVKTQ